VKLAQSLQVQELNNSESLIEYLDVSENNGTPKSSILRVFHIKTIHFGVPIFLETPICL